MIFLGIDPGMNGAVSAIDDFIGKNDPEYCISVNFKDLTPKDISESIKSFIRGNKFCVIENLHAMPMNGKVGNFKLGRSFGMLEGFLWTLEIPFERASPQAWQKYMGCMTRGDKNVSKAKAQQLFPKMKITHANADSVLLAEYARRIWLAQNGVVGEQKKEVGVYVSDDLKKLINPDVFANCEKK